MKRAADYSDRPEWPTFDRLARAAAGVLGFLPQTRWPGLLAIFSAAELSAVGDERWRGNLATFLHAIESALIETFWARCDAARGAGLEQLRRKNLD